MYGWQQQLPQKGTKIKSQNWGQVRFLSNKSEDMKWEKCDDLVPKKYKHNYSSYYEY